MCTASVGEVTVCIWSGLYVGTVAAFGGGFLASLKWEVEELKCRTALRVDVEVDQETGSVRGHSWRVLGSVNKWEVGERSAVVHGKTTGTGVQADFIQLVERRYCNPVISYHKQLSHLAFGMAFG